MDEKTRNRWRSLGKGRADLCADGMKMRKEMEIVEAETVRQ